MHKYYIPEIHLRDIRNNTHLMEKLEKNFNKTSNKNSIIIASNGYYKYDKDKLIKFKIIEKESNITTNFIDTYSLIGINQYEKKIGEVFNIPYENEHIIIEKIKFNVGNSNHFLIFEKRNNKIIDVYFLSTKKLNEKCQFFTNDVSSFMKMLMCK